MVKKDLKPEPMIVSKRTVSNGEGRLPLLKNQIASRMADELTISEALESAIFTEEEAHRLMSEEERCVNV